MGNPIGVCQSEQRQAIDEIRRMNEWYAEDSLDPEFQTRTSQYELAFKMKTSVPELTEMSDEPQSILDLYGVKQPSDGSFASKCLLARRLAERGTRSTPLCCRHLESTTSA